MHTQIITQPLHLHIHGFSGTAPLKDYASTAFKLMDRMWAIVKEKGIKNKGLNIWVYEPNDSVFAGVELNDPNEPDTGMEQRQIALSKYGYYKHIGPYHLIGQAVQKMTAEINSRGYETTLPYIELYGHWNQDESKLETALLMSLK